eukprot:2391617-Karenia_brevis.AAC.1
MSERMLEDYVNKQRVAEDEIRMRGVPQRSTSSAGGSRSEGERRQEAQQPQEQSKKRKVEEANESQVEDNSEELN